MKSKLLQLTSMDVTEAEADRFRKAGYAPVLRWAKFVGARESKALKSREVRTLIARREAKESA